MIYNRYFKNISSVLVRKKPNATKYALQMPKVALKRPPKGLFSKKNCDKKYNNNKKGGLVGREGGLINQRPQNKYIFFFINLFQITMYTIVSVKI